MAKKASSKPKLSASKIKVFSDCSWLYYCKYILKLPDAGNAGSKRGSVSHTVFEILLPPRHKRHFDAVVNANNISASPAIERLINRNAKKLGIANPEDISLIHSMVLTGLKQDFFCDGCIDIKAEDEFYLESPNFIINGFIDKKAKYPNGEVRIFDYKSSKKVFSKDELENNLQNLMYSLACYKTEGVIPKITFLFLRFPKKIVQDAPQCTENQLLGFESYLDSLADKMKGFSEKDAKTKLAANVKEKRWLCGRNQFRGQLKEDETPVWGCECKFAFDYWALIDKDKKVIKTAFKKEDLTLEPDCSIIRKAYSGCPAYTRQIDNF